MHHDQQCHKHQNKVLSRNNRARTRESKGEPFDPNGEFHTHVPTDSHPQALCECCFGVTSPVLTMGSPGGCSTRAGRCVLGGGRKGDEDEMRADEGAGHSNPRRHRHESRESRIKNQGRILTESDGEVEGLVGLAKRQRQRQRQRQPTVPCDSRVPTVAVLKRRPRYDQSEYLVGIKTLGPAWP